MVQALAGYERPANLADKSGNLHEQQVIDWVSQFQADEFVEEALEVLKRLRMIGRQEIVTAVATFIDANPEFRGAYTCPLGEPKDSSAVCTYISADLSTKFQLKVLGLEDALRRRDKNPILFVDDFIGSGRQSVTIVEALLGLPLSYDLGEARATLPEDLRPLLREKTTAFVFAAGLEAGSGLLRARIEAEGLLAKVFIGLDDKQLPTLLPIGQRSIAQPSSLPLAVARSANSS